MCDFRDSPYEAFRLCRMDAGTRSACRTAGIEPEGDTLTPRFFALGRKYARFSTSVHPELVEGPSFSLGGARKEKRGFDKLSPSGIQGGRMPPHQHIKNHPVQTHEVAKVQGGGALSDTNPAGP